MLDTTPTWLFMSNPLPSYQDAPLQAFVDAVLSALGLAGVAPDPCRPRLLWATRDPEGGPHKRRARLVLNEGEAVGAAREALPAVDVQVGAGAACGWGGWQAVCQALLRQFCYKQGGAAQGGLAFRGLLTLAGRCI